MEGVREDVRQGRWWRDVVGDAPHRDGLARVSLDLLPLAQQPDLNVDSSEGKRDADDLGE